MKGIVIFCVIVGLVLGAGVWMQADLHAVVNDGVAVLTDADGYCRSGNYALSQEAAEHFCALWNSRRSLYRYLYKYELLEEIDRAVHKLIPLLVEMNLSEYRALCLETVHHLRLLESYERFGAQGVL